MNARKVLDLIKLKLDIKTDKELAAELGVKYGALTSALSRGSLQYENVILLLLKKNVDLNEIFMKENSTVQNNYNSSGISMFGQGIVNYKSDFNTKHEELPEIINEAKDKYDFYKRNGGELITNKFEEDIKILFEKYDNKVNTIIELMK